MGYKKRWDKAKTIYEVLGDKLDEKLKPFVHDYPINLFEIAYLTDKQVEKFKSDFRIVADYLVQMRKDNSYTPPSWQIKHVREVLSLMAALTRDTRFRDVAIEMKKGDEPKNMCEVLDRVENKGVTKGKKDTADLMAFLVQNGRADDVVKASNDESFLDKLLADFKGGLLKAH